MIQRLKRIFCFFMAIQMLLASTGFAMTEHFCKFRGKKTYIFSETKSCCCDKMKEAKNNSEPQIKMSKCCQDVFTYHKINVNASQGYTLEFNAQPFAWIVNQVTFLGLNSRISDPVSFNTTHYYSPAPPLSGRDRLIFFQSFLV
jgi:hypothetical protein